jgi:hypothetical protein
MHSEIVGVGGPTEQKCNLALETALRTALASFTVIDLEVDNSGGDCRGDSSAISYENGLLI